MASGIGCLTDKVKTFHRYMINKYEQDHVDLDNLADQKSTTDGLVSGVLRS